MTLPATDRFLPAGQAAPAFAVTSFGLTDTGRVRPNNEDCFLIAELRKALRVRQSSLPQTGTRLADERGHLFVVADGMGGHAGGERASALAVEAAEDFVLNVLEWFDRLGGGDTQGPLGELQSALREADRRVCREARERPELRGMGTTLTMAYAVGRDLYVVHAGDSRCYLGRGGQLLRLTRDHTLVADLVAAGAVRPEDAVSHPWRHMVTNVIGGPEEGVQVDVRKGDLEPDDVLLLCTDGLTEMVPEGTVAGLLIGAVDPQGACENLVAAANEAGGTDNITVVVARFGEPT